MASLPVLRKLHEKKHIKNRLTVDPLSISTNNTSADSPIPGTENQSQQNIPTFCVYSPNKQHHQGIKTMPDPEMEIHPTLAFPLTAIYRSQFSLHSSTESIQANRHPMDLGPVWVRPIES